MKRALEKYVFVFFISAFELAHYYALLKIIVFSGSPDYEIEIPGDSFVSALKLRHVEFDSLRCGIVIMVVEVYVEKVNVTRYHQVVKNIGSHYLFAIGRVVGFEMSWTSLSLAFCGFFYSSSKRIFAPQSGVF